MVQCPPELGREGNCEQTHGIPTVQMVSQVGGAAKAPEAKRIVKAEIYQELDGLAATKVAGISEDGEIIDAETTEGKQDD